MVKDAFAKRKILLRRGSDRTKEGLRKFLVWSVPLYGVETKTYTF